MINPLVLKTIKKDYKIYPNKPGHIVEMVGNDNTLYDAIVGTNELNLALYIKQLKSKLKPNEIKKLIELIDEFGQEQYEEGSEDNFID